MKTLGIFLVSVIICFGIDTNAQTEHLNKVPEQQSAVVNGTKYKWTMELISRDLNKRLPGHSISSGYLIQLSPDNTIQNITFQGTFQLQDVSVIKINGHERNKKDLDGLKFKIEGDNFTKLDFYKNFPSEHIDLVRTIIQDKVAFEAYGKMYLDSLKFNVPFYPDFFQNQHAEFEQSVNFNTQKLNLTWLGFSKKNNKDCILIYYKSMYSPFTVNSHDGRSCFWGNIWISSDTKEIEYATMNEDILVEDKIGDSDKQWFNRQREVTYEKTQ
ncbi:MAG: hypothetical protein LBV43_13970 [Prevotella sp.]|jgi:hypothetical protein|nr:hypothetical protein [Prevotella sp.]